MTKKMLVVILTFIIAVGAVELLAKEGFATRCHCFNEPAAVSNCIAQCTQRGTVCRGVCALVCTCQAEFCDCKYIYFCNDDSYGYGYVYQGCSGECPGQVY